MSTVPVKEDDEVQEVMSPEDYDYTYTYTYDNPMNSEDKRVRTGYIRVPPKMARVDKSRVDDLIRRGRRLMRALGRAVVSAEKR